MFTQFNINHQLSIHIPYINQAQATTEYISNIFHRFNIGYVKDIEFKLLPAEVNYENQNYYYSAIIFMNYWYNNKMVERLQDKIINNEDGARIVYDDPQYWIIYPAVNKLQSEYLMKIEQKYSDKFYEMEQKYSEKFYQMEQKYSEKFYEMEQKQYEIKIIDNLYINNSCCGAVTDAWKPSSLSIKPNT